MPLDSHLNADHERGMLWHVALTSNLPNNDSRKFKMGTPGQVGDCMDRTWQVFPTSERIVSDINKFPKAVDAIIEADGAVVPELDTRTDAADDRGYLAAAASRLSLWWSGNRRPQGLTADADSGAGLQARDEGEDQPPNGDAIPAPPADGYEESDPDQLYA
eukprot:COSAG05_NODE_998_length_6249_cov_30.416260_1_plen_161_part_00